VRAARERSASADELESRVSSGARAVGLLEDSLHAHRGRAVPAVHQHLGRDRAKQGAPGGRARNEPGRPLALRKDHVRVLLRLERDADQREPRGERRLYAPLPTCRDSQIDPRHDLVAWQQLLNEHVPILEIGECVDGRADENTDVESSQSSDDVPNELRRARRDRDIDDRPRPGEKLLYSLG